MYNMENHLKQEMNISDWKRLVDELADHHVTSLLLRGGEVFLFPGIIELMDYIKSKGIFTSIDTNGTKLYEYASDIARIGNLHLTISVDGPEHIHDRVRGVKGCFKRIKEGLLQLKKYEEKNNRLISKSITFTISSYSLEGLGIMPDIARSLSIPTIAIVPYYYIPESMGLKYEKELIDHFHCPAFSWKGFHHEESGVDFSVFKAGYTQYLQNLRQVYNYPYMSLTEDEYREWFKNPGTQVGPSYCNNIEKLIDIQPRGDTNFCVDFPDYSIGNVRESTISEVWNSERAEAFRTYRRKKPLVVCYRCGAKYMSEIKSL